MDIGAATAAAARVCLPVCQLLCLAGDLVAGLTLGGLQEQPRALRTQLVHLQSS